MRLYFILLILIGQKLFATQLNINVSLEDKQTYPYIVGIGKELSKELPGTIIEVLKKIEKELNVKFNFKREQGIRGQKALQTNQADILLFASYSKDRESLGVYPKTKDGKVDSSLKAMDLSYVLYTLKNSRLDWDGENFINLNGKIGATKGYSIVKFLKEKGAEVSENTSNLGDPRKLIAKRIQGFANQESKIDIYLKENPNYAKKIKKIKIPLKTKPYYILFSKKFYSEHKEIAQKIWKLTSNHKNNPKYKSIVVKYE